MQTTCDLWCYTNEKGAVRMDKTVYNVFNYDIINRGKNNSN